MIRPVLTEVALFLVPFLAYAVFLWATRAGGTGATAAAVIGAVKALAALLSLNA